MSDCHSPEVRSRNMAKIRNKDTKPEIIVRRYLFSKGLRFRNNVTTLPGTPDIVLKKYKTVIFVNGCFWHHHDCSRFKWPTSNKDYWRTKILHNVQRDKDNYIRLKALGWKVLIVWECAIKNKSAGDYLQNIYEKIVF